MKKETLQKFDKLLSFLNNQGKYKNQFIKSIENSLFDFAVIVVWKIFILFVYEKIYQIAHQLGEDVFLQKWEGKFRKKPKNYKKGNIYWLNEEQNSDDRIIQFLSVIYRIDSNFISQLEGVEKEKTYSCSCC